MIIKSEKAMKRKGQFLFIVFICSLIVLIGQLTYIVLIEGKNYDLAVLQNAARREGSVTLNDKRGLIVDRNGIVLADSTSTYDLIFDAKLLSSQKEEVQKETKDFLNDKLGINPKDLDDIIVEKPNSHYVIIGEGYTYTQIKEVKDAIDNYQLIGVFYREDYERVYPYPELASDVIGFLNSDFKGAQGIELSYDAFLKGEVGRIYGTIDEDNMMEVQEIEAVNGANVMLTLDYTIQKYLKDSIENYLAEEQASKIHIIVMNPNNGEILGMANWPDYNLENPYDVISHVTDEEYVDMTDLQKVELLNHLWNNEIVLDAYEPGSTFKPFVFAAALEENIISLDDTFTCYGSKQVADRRIKCWKPEGHGVQTIEEGLQNSCNVVFMEVGEAIGRDLFHKYQSTFGFGAQTGIDLSSESSARANVFSVDQLNITELATSSFGQGFLVTPIQLISGFSSLINGGYLYQPHFMKKIYTEDQIVETNDKTLMRQVVSEEVAAITREALGGVVNEGTGGKASIAGYEIGGKTGTAEKWPRDNTHYIVSFIGFAPIENPQVVTLVVVDEPVGFPVNSRFAAKIFVDVMEDVMPYLHIFKNEEISEDGVNVEGVTQETSTDNNQNQESVEEITSTNEGSTDGSTVEDIEEVTTTGNN